MTAHLHRLRMGIVTAIVLVAAGGAAAAVNVSYTNSWRVAQARAGFALRYPPSVFGLPSMRANGKRLTIGSCASVGRAVYAQWGRIPANLRTRQLSLAQTDVRASHWPCSNQGIAGLVRTVRVRGHRAAITAYCSPALKAPAGMPKPPPCSSRWVSFDLTWHEGKAWIRAEGYGFHSATLVDWARRLTLVH